MNGVMVAHPGGWDPVNKKSSRIAGYVKIGLGSNPNSSTNGRYFCKKNLLNFEKFVIFNTVWESKVGVSIADSAKMDGEERDVV